MKANVFKNTKCCKYIMSISMMFATIFSTQTSLMADTVGIADSTVEINFTEGDADVSPLDPDDLTPGNGGSESSGPLALNHVSNLDFGTHEISALTAEYPSETKRPYVQITDLRGTGAGWEITARASKFMNKGEESLKGSTIKFTDASLATPTIDIAEPIPENSFILNADGDLTVKVASAKKDTGMGTWLVKWYNYPSSLPNYSVSLNVPSASAMLAENRATITWTLIDAPTS